MWRLAHAPAALRLSTLLPGWPSKLLARSRSVISATLAPVNRLQEIANPNLAVPFGRSPLRERLHNQPFAGHSMEDNAHPRQA